MPAPILAWEEVEAAAAEELLGHRTPTVADFELVKKLGDGSVDCSMIGWLID
jgi:hypothetical protein